MEVVEVTFAKLSGRRYTMTVVREVGPELATRQGPGYHDYVPHDAVHFLAEAEAGLTGGAFGQIASGRNNIFATVDPALRRRQSRREAKRRSPDRSAEMIRSESLASLCLPLWELRHGHRRAMPEWSGRFDRDLVTSPVIDRIQFRLDDFAARWSRLPVGGTLRLTWPLDRHGNVVSVRDRTGRSVRQNQRRTDRHRRTPRVKPRR
jgi:hypothetical protein